MNKTYLEIIIKRAGLEDVVNSLEQREKINYPFSQYLSERYKYDDIPENLKNSNAELYKDLKGEYSNIINKKVIPFVGTTIKRWNNNIYKTTVEQVNEINSKLKFSELKLFVDENNNQIIVTGEEKYNVFGNITQAEENLVNSLEKEITNLYLYTVMFERGGNIANPLVWENSYYKDLTLYEVTDEIKALESLRDKTLESEKNFHSLSNYLYSSEAFNKYIEKEPETFSAIKKSKYTFDFQLIKDSLPNLNILKEVSLVHPEDITDVYQKLHSANEETLLKITDKEVCSLEKSIEDIGELLNKDVINADLALVTLKTFYDDIKDAKKRAHSQLKESCSIEKTYSTTNSNKNHLNQNKINLPKLEDLER